MKRSSCTGAGLTSASDAFVFFGGTGDLAYKKIWPALQAMVARGGFDMPVISVAHSGWTVDQLRERARDSLAHDRVLDEAAFEKLPSQLRSISGIYNDAATFERRRKDLGRERLILGKTGCGKCKAKGAKSNQKK